VIHGICIKLEKLRDGKRSMYPDISVWHTVNLGTLSCLTDTRWCRWQSGQRWRWFWWRFTSFIASPECAWVPCSAIFARKAAIRLILTNHCRQSFYCSIRLSIPRNSTASVFPSRTSEWGFLFRYCISPVVVCENPPLANFAIFKAKCTLNGSGCTRPPCLAIVADMFKTYTKVVAASKNEIRLLFLP